MHDARMCRSPRLPGGRGLFPLGGAVGLSHESLPPVTLTLILVRHAKSDWSDAVQDDFDRPLNERGRREAPLIGRWLAENAACPEVALVSAARRTVETWELLADTLPRVAADVARRLYLAGPEAILEAVRRRNEACVLVLAHNPGIGECATLLAKSPPNHPRFEDYPTGATTVLEFDAETWTDVVWHSGILRGFMVPRDAS